MTGGACLALLAILAVMPASSLSFTADAKNKPITKVVTLLTDMLKQLEAEKAADQEIYDKMVCWCTTNDKAKTEEIDDEKEEGGTLTTRITEYTAISIRLTHTLASLEAKLVELRLALEKAIKLCKKRYKTFTGTEEELMAVIKQLEEAIAVLAKHNEASLLQVPRKDVKSLHAVAAILQNAMQKHAPLLKGSLTNTERKAAESFIQAVPEYAPQSGEIYGVLTQMLETFQAELDARRSDEGTDSKSCEELIAALEAQIAAVIQQRDRTESELAEIKTKLEETTGSKKDNDKTLAADEEYLMMLKEKCSSTDKEFEERTRTRQLEMEAVQKAIEIFSGQKDLFARTFQTGTVFMQEKSTSNSAQRQQASQLLSVAARQLHIPRLAALAMKVRLDAFTKVKKAISDLIAELLRQKDAEIKKKDYCVGALNTNELETQTGIQTKTDLESLMDDLRLKIDKLSKAIEQLKAEITDAQLQLKRTTEDREKQSKTFQLTVADQDATLKLLKQALAVLQEFYGESFFVQRLEQPGPPPPTGFKPYEKNAAAGGVTTLIQQIIDDAEAMKAEAIKDETEAANVYGDFVAETTKNIDAKKKDIVDTSETKAKAEMDLAQADTDHSDQLAALDQLATQRQELHDECDFVMKNFDVRQSTRDAEVEALKQAKAILSGAKFAAFLERR